MIKNKNAVFAAVAAVLLVLLGIAVYYVSQAQKYTAVVEDIADQFPLKAEPVDRNPQLAESDGPRAIIHTTAGDITILLYPEQAPKAVENFITLAKEGYYDGSEFHYVMKDDVVQTGKPIAGNPAAETPELPDGVPAYYALEKSIWETPFEDEFDDGLHNFTGAVGMVGHVNGDDKNLSQFYFMVKEAKPELDRQVAASFYFNELVKLRMDEFREKYRIATPSQQEITDYEDALNQELEDAMENIPEEYQKRYQSAVERYMEVGGAWSLDYRATVFGQIVEGLNVASALSQVKVEPSTRAPKKQQTILSIEIIE